METKIQILMHAADAGPAAFLPLLRQAEWECILVRLYAESRCLHQAAGDIALGCPWTGLDKAPIECYSFSDTAKCQRRGRPVQDVLFLWCKAMMTRELNSTGNVAIFFCQQIDPDQDANRRSVEKQLGRAVRFYPLPCSGRIETLHILKAFETGARKVFVVACPVGLCRYGQGNLRARKRVEYARKLIGEVGLTENCVEMINVAEPLPVPVTRLARQLLGREVEADRSSGRAMSSHARIEEKRSSR